MEKLFTKVALLQRKEVREKMNLRTLRATPPKWGSACVAVGTNPSGVTGVVSRASLAVSAFLPLWIQSVSGWTHTPSHHFSH